MRHQNCTRSAGITARNGPNSKEWSEAAQCEFDSLKKNGKYGIWSIGSGKNLVEKKWIFKHKRGPGGEITRYKARHVAQGYSQQHGVDYDEVCTRREIHLNPLCTCNR